MKTGVSTACFFGREQIEDSFDTLRRMGVDVTEVFLNTFSEYEKGFVEQLAARRGGINVHSVHAHGTCFEPELFSSHDRIRADAEETFKKVCAAGFMLGAKYYTFHGPALKVSRPFGVDYLSFSARLNRLCEIAAGYGMKIAYENVSWAYGNNLDFFRTLLPLCPELKTTLDVKQAIYSGLDPIKVLDVMGSRLATVHICDMDAKNHPCLAGKGKYPFAKFFKALAADYPDMTVLIEVYKDCYSSYDELAENYRYVSELVKNTGK